MSALLVTTGVHTIPGSGRETGAYASEVAESWQELTVAGHRVDLVTVGGGAVPLEALDSGDPTQRALLADPRMAGLLADAPPIAAQRGGHHDIVLLAGGHGAACDLPDDADLAAILVAGYERGGVVASVCHGAAGLLGARLSDGTPLVAGRRVAAFSDDEERAVGMLGSMPYLLSDALTRLGAYHDFGAPFLPHVIVDDRLVSGQNPASTRGVARAAVAAAGTPSGATREEGRAWTALSQPSQRPR
ncbi:MAG: type 1 glutamine amidotransferase domain-containing protein [Pseudonocardiaceae bacterium]